MVWDEWTSYYGGGEYGFRREAALASFRQLLEGGQGFAMRVDSHVSLEEGGGGGGRGSTG